MDGAGVSLTRIFGFGDTAAFDPFLLLDHFGSDNAEEYLAGFPWHPHRGIDTVTYMQKGKCVTATASAIPVSSSRATSSG